MELKLCLALILLSCGCIAKECTEKNDKIVACYYASWANYRPDEGQFNISNIDTTLCTHLIYTFAGLDINSKIASLDYNLDVGQGFYTAFTALKEKNECLKTLLAIGGWKEGSIKYSVMTSTEESQDAFVESALRFVVNYGFDGLDIDWEYPGHRGGITDDRTNFVSLLKKLKNRFDQWNLMLTVAVPMSQEVTQAAYNIPEIKAAVDYVFLMAYDFTETTSNTTGLIAPMTEVHATVKMWTEDFASPEKIVLGVPTYARTFNLNNKDNNNIGDATSGLGIAGEYTKEAGFLSYYELQFELLSEMYVEVEVEGEDNCYAYSKEGTEWFTYENLNNYKAKAEYVCNNKLGGMMLWTIDTDNFQGMFGLTNYTILRTIREAMECPTKHTNLLFANKPHF